MTEFAPEATDRLASAVAWASKIHADQVRKASGAPYMSHLLATAATVMQCGGDDDAVIAALLHDSVEDHPDKVTFDDIEEHFGKRVAEIVAAVTEKDKSKPWAERKAAYEQHLRQSSSDAALVSMADKAHNLRSLLLDVRAHGQGVWNRFNAERDDILSQYAKLIRVYQVRLSHLDAVQPTLRGMEADLEALLG